MSSGHVSHRITLAGSGKEQEPAEQRSAVSVQANEHRMLGSGVSDAERVAGATAATLAVADGSDAGETDFDAWWNATVYPNGERSEQPAEPADSLETEVSTVTGGWQDPVTVDELVACNCRSRFCEHCCQGLGLKLREAVVKEVETWSAIMMLTLTQSPSDYETPNVPEKFRGPEGAFRYCREERAVALTMERLHLKGHLRSLKYIVVTEWQEATEMAHYHVLVESDFVPKDLLNELWGRFQPSFGVPREPGGPPPFGITRFSKPSFCSPLHAARYITKYLTKHPEKGYPEWVLDFKGRIRKFSTSRQVRLNGTASEMQVDEEQGERECHEHDACGLAPSTHDPECFCDLCNGDIEFVDCTKTTEARAKKPVRTLRERLSGCGGNGALVRTTYRESWDFQQTKFVGRQFVCVLRHLTFEEAKSLTSRRADAIRTVMLEASELEEIIRREAERAAEGQAVERRLYDEYQHGVGYEWAERDLFERDRGW